MPALSMLCMLSHVGGGPPLEPGICVHQLPFHDQSASLTQLARIELPATACRLVRLPSAPDVPTEAPLGSVPALT